MNLTALRSNENLKLSSGSSFDGSQGSKVSAAKHLPLNNWNISASVLKLETGEESSAGKGPCCQPDHLNPTPGPRRRKERTSYHKLSSDLHTRAQTCTDIQNKQRGMKYLAMGTIKGSHFSFLCGYVSLQGHTLTCTLESRGQTCVSFSGIIHLALWDWVSHWPGMAK